MSPEDNIVQTNLAGGIGNQLFTYFAGRYLSELTESRLLVNFLPASYGETIHNDDISKLNLLGNFVHGVNHQKNYRCEGRVERLLVRSSIVSNVTLSKLTKRYVSTEIGFDPNLNKLLSPISVFGYFQTWRYFKSLSHFDFAEFHLKNPSTWYLEMKEKAQNVQPIMMHVRRGDYLKAVNRSFGILKDAYYGQALGKLRQKGLENCVWIFSDDLAQAVSELKHIVPGDSLFIENPPESNALETLKLMSMGSANIIANSTFSYWGAMLNVNSKAVVAPTPWFKKLETPNELIPIHWLQLHSEWH